MISKAYALKVAESAGERISDYRLKMNGQDLDAIDPWSTSVKDLFWARVLLKEAITLIDKAR
jgi:hypothetical protein